MRIDSEFNDIDALGDDHVSSSSETPMRDDAFKLTNEEKMDIIKDDVEGMLRCRG